MIRPVIYVPRISEMEETQNGTEVISEKSKGLKVSGIDKRNQTVDLKDNINSAIKIYRKLFKYIAVEN